MKTVDELKALKKDLEEIQIKLALCERQGRVKSLVFTKLQEAGHWLNDLISEAIEDEQPITLVPGTGGNQ